MYLGDGIFSIYFHVKKIWIQVSETSGGSALSEAPAWLTLNRSPNVRNKFTMRKYKIQ